MTAKYFSASGISRNVEWHQLYHGGISYDYLLTFLIEETDRFDNITGYTAVEFRSKKIHNICEEGDEVEVSGELGTDNIICAERIQNLKTLAILVQKSTETSWIEIFSSYVFLVAFIGVLIFILIIAFGM